MTMRHLLSGTLAAALTFGRAQAQTAPPAPNPDSFYRLGPDSLEQDISKDPERHGIGGASSGAIAAFTVAWQRPDDFRKVVSIVGSFTNIRGGHVYPELVLEAERKPIRVFLQDGRN